MPISNLLNQFGQKFRAYNKGVTGMDQYVIPTSARVIAAQVMVSTFRIASLGTANHNIFYVKNASSAKLMGVRRMVLEVDADTAKVTLSPAAYVYKIDAGGTLPTGGTACTKAKFDSVDTMDANCTAVGAASAEGTASAITYTAPAGTPAWRQSIDRIATEVGFVSHLEEPLIPILCEYDPIILRNTEALVVQINIASVAADTHYVVKCMWDEFTLP